MPPTITEEISPTKIRLHLERVSKAYEVLGKITARSAQVEGHLLNRYRSQGVTPEEYNELVRENAKIEERLVLIKKDIETARVHRDAMLEDLAKLLPADALFKVRLDSGETWLLEVNRHRNYEDEPDFATLKNIGHTEEGE